MDAATSAKLLTPGLSAELRLDRAAERRGDREWIASRLQDARSRMLLLVDLKVSILPAAPSKQSGLRWYSSEDI
ncbi:MAG: hypothetical protein VX871_02325, partial [Pseudomonadota bacterium]|nr:hypothetical protein [Pseudomonadota bacterium]